MPSRPCANPWKKAGWPWPGLAATPCFQAGLSWWPPPTRVPQEARRPSGPLNGALTGAQLRRDARLDDPEHALLEAAADRLHLTGRAIHRVLRVARTIADLE